MKPLSLLGALIGLCVLSNGCATRQRDHFYVLDARPAGARESRAQFDRQVTLRVTLPSLVDRGEMLLTTPNGVTVLDHERWAAPLADLVTTTLSQDIERRRNDVVVLTRSADPPGLPLIKIAIEIDQVTARLGDQVIIEVHWRVTDPRTGKMSIGRDAFASSERPQSYMDVASALSTCIALLADRLVQEIPVA
jgi:uncharacterized lipoprotein YmbA